MQAVQSQWLSLTEESVVPAQLLAHLKIVCRTKHREVRQAGRTDTAENTRRSPSQSNVKSPFHALLEVPVTHGPPDHGRR